VERKEPSKQLQASRPNFNSFDIGHAADELSDSEDALKKSNDLLSDDGSSSFPKGPRQRQNPFGRSKRIARSNSQTSDEFGFGKPSTSATSSSPAGVTKGYASSLGRSSLSQLKSKLNNQRSGSSNLLGLPIDWNQAGSHR
jgi:hypothetical protein